jgi:hypothetical protein
MISGLALYPAGFLGTGLLFLRVSVAGSLIVISGVSVGSADALQFFSVLMALGLCIGVGTRALAGLSLMLPVFWLVRGETLPAPSAIHIINTLALILAGPGAWSADAVLFGRRIVTLPGRDDTNV